MRLQFAAETSDTEEEAFELPALGKTKDGRLLLPTTALFSEIVRRRLAGESVSRLAMMFHASLADMITAACSAAREMKGIPTVALSGGVFQNTLLLRLVEKKLCKDGFEVLRHRLIPANDGGLSLGQAVCAAARMMENY